MRYTIVDNFQKLGLEVAVRFLDWASQNPEGVISLPTGKTPEYFIKWTQHVLTNWDKEETRRLFADPHFQIFSLFQHYPTAKPSLTGLTFVQMDDFFPINPAQHNSFIHYVKEFYIKGFGLDEKRAMLIDTDDIMKPACCNWSQLFLNGSIDLSLRHRDPGSKQEEMQRDAIFMIDNWCMEYEQKIRQLGGIGFFLGGIGPDGHIAFNIKGSDHQSTTRLCATNYETQAAAAGDLGGIEVSGSRSVITIGLGTITHNPSCQAIIFAAGETKAPMVRDAIENQVDARYPGTALHKLKDAEFIVTKGAASLLSDERKKQLEEGEWGVEKSMISLLDYCKSNNVYAHKIKAGGQEGKGRGQEGKGQKESEKGEEIAGMTGEVIEEVKVRLARGIEPVRHQTILHTGPHHDDIMLGLLPVVNRQLRDPSNRVSFAVFTSGFTALSNHYLVDRLEHTLALIEGGGIQMLQYPDFFEKGYLFKFDKDVNHYLNKVAERDEEGKWRGLSHRIVRCMVGIYGVKGTDELKSKIRKVVDYLKNCYDGEKNTPDIQQLKGMIREFEEELVWAHSGILVKDVYHMRLGFYKGDIFTEQPERHRDVEPTLDLLRRLKPNIISVTMDPEGSGPDTHYKVLQTIARAVKIWMDENPGHDLRIHGYRNVWYRYHPAEANVYVPVSLNALASLQNSFRQCYLSQVDASFPSPQLRGPFCDLAQKIWVDQFKEIQLLLGKDFFYENERPLYRATHGLIFYKELSVEEFLSEAQELQRLTE